MSDQEPRAAAIKAAIQAAMPAGVTVYDADEVPGATGGPSGTLPPRYVTVEISDLASEVRRLSEETMLSPGALSTHYRAPSVSDARELRRRAESALKGRIYDLPTGGHVGPFLFEFDGGLEYVAEGWSGFDSWNF